MLVSAYRSDGPGGRSHGSLDVSGDDDTRALLHGSSEFETSLELCFLATRKLYTRAACIQRRE